MKGHPNNIKAGDRFSRLIVVRWYGRSSGGDYMWECLCDCGRTSKVRACALKHGRIHSCGCLKNEMASISNATHRMSAAPEYYVWSSMKDRCAKPQDPAYRNYGGRGIQVCDRWKESFENFLADMGERPTDKHTLDRVDNDGNYEPGNVEWRTRLQQNRNRRDNVRLTFQGRTLCITEWADVIGMNKGSLWARLNKGWSIERALTTPKVPAGSPGVIRGPRKKSQRLTDKEIRDQEDKNSSGVAG